MKSCLLIYFGLLLNAVLVCASLDFGNIPLDGIKKEITPRIAHFAISRFVDGLNRQHQQQSRDPVLPPLPDPIELEDQFYDFGDLCSDQIEGNLTLSQGTIVGLSTVYDDLLLRFTVPARAEYRANASYIAIEDGDYSLEVLLNSSLSLTGAGNLTGNISGPFIEVDVALLVNLITNRISVTSLSINLGFTGLYIRAEDFAVDGQLVEWEWFDENAVPLFDFIYGLVRANVETQARALLNEIISGCRVTDLIGGNFDCIIEGLPDIPTPSCPPPEGTTPSEDTNPPPTEDPTNPSPTTTPPEDTTSAGTTPISYYCFSNDDCPTGQYCEIGTRQCYCIDTLYSNQVGYNPARCERLVGATCLLNSSDPNYEACTTNSVCVASNLTSGRCECNTGFYGTEEGTCGAGLGQSCNGYNSYCFEEFMLSCRNGQCGCASPTLVFEPSRGCVAQEGEPCGIHNDREEPYRLQCATGLECVQLRLGRNVCQAIVEPSAYSIIEPFKLFISKLYK